MIKKLTYSISFILLSLTFCEKSYSDIQNEIKANNKILDTLESSIKKLESDINSMESSKENLSQNIEMINQKIEYRQKQIALLEQQDRYITDLINTSSSNIESKENELSALKLKLKQRAIHIFKYGKENIISKMILDENWNQTLTKLKYLEILLEYEKKLNLKIKSKINELEVEKKNLENDKKNQRGILTEAETINKKLKKDKKNKLEKIKKIESDKNKLEENLTDKKKKINDIENVIKRLITDSNEAKKREEILARERAKQNKATSGNFAKMKGRLNWPTDGKIITKFGKKVNSRLNTVTENIGINIETEKNSPVYTVLDGDVSIVSYLRGYGNYIVIRHGEGYFTVYANLKDITVKQGEYIGSNIQIANVNSSNDSNISNRSYLHFEIWKNETKLDPELWIVKK